LEPDRRQVTTAIYSIDDDLTFADLFCGAGGSIRGLVDAGFRLVLGANHSDRAIETVSTNHRGADFLCCDINALDKRRLPKTRVLWASVICTEISPAGGKKKLRGQGTLEELGHIPSDSYIRTRACALDVVQAAEVHRYDAIVVENVLEFATDWELYDWWVEGMCKLGYRVQVVNASAAHVYGPGNAPAPQWRDRIYIVFTRLDVPAPDLELRPPAWCFSCEEVVDGVQSWKRLDRARLGKYGPQYVFRCPNEGCRHSVVEPFILPAEAAIDLADVGQRIGDRDRPLAKNTRARIQWGIDTFVRPVIATVAGNTYEAGSYKRVWPAGASPMPARTGTASDAIVQPAFYVKNYGGAKEVHHRSHPISDPLGAITTQDSHGLVGVPLVVNSNHDDVRTIPAGQAPLPSRTTKIGEAVVTPFVTMARTNGRAVPTDREPLMTVATGNHHYLTSPPGSFYVKNFGGNAKPSDCARPLAQPLGTITTKDHHALVIPYRRGARPRLAGDRPLDTITTKESHALLHPAVEVDDCYYRMLKPREHARGQRFPDTDIITGNIGEQTLQVGNAVPCNVAQWIGQQLRVALDGAVNR
jgi:DNA (cytosine-5)-methyltransferase 1